MNSRKKLPINIKKKKLKNLYLFLDVCIKDKYVCWKKKESLTMTGCCCCSVCVRACVCLVIVTTITAVM